MSSQSDFMKKLPSELSPAERDYLEMEAKKVARDIVARYSARPYRLACIADSVRTLANERVGQELGRRKERELPKPASAYGDDRDVGAGYGEYSHAFSNLFGSEGKN